MQSAARPRAVDPTSTEAEESLLGCCLAEGDDGRSFSRAQEEGITSESFCSPQTRTVWDAIVALNKKKQAIALEPLASELRCSGQYIQVGGHAFLIQVTNKAPTTAFLATHIAEVKRDALKRRLSRFGQILREKSEGFVGDLAELEEVVARFVAEVSLGSVSSRNACLSDLESRRLTASRQPTEPETRLFLADKPIATPGNIQTVIAKAKSGKTASIGAMVAAAVAAAKGAENCDTLKFSAADPAGRTLLLIDTEQSTFDAYACLMRALARADDSDDPAWLAVYSLAGYPATALRDALRSLLKDLARRGKNVFAVVLDGVADFVSDVNDPKECNELVAELHALAIEYDCPITCVIHSNEGVRSGDDGRGHLGKQLTRKAESNLLLKKVDDVTTLTSEKQRKAPITEADGVAFKWSDEEGRHVTCALPNKARDEDQRRQLTILAEEAFGSDKALRWTELQRRIADARSLKGNTPARRIDKMVDLGVIKKAHLGTYELVK